MRYPNFSIWKLIPYWIFQLKRDCRISAATMKEIINFLPNPTCTPPPLPLTNYYWSEKNVCLRPICLEFSNWHTHLLILYQSKPVFRPTFRNWIQTIMTHWKADKKDLSYIIKESALLRYQGRFPTISYSRNSGWKWPRCPRIRLFLPFWGLYSACLAFFKGFLKISSLSYFTGSCRPSTFEFPRRVNLHALYRLNLLFLKGQRCVICVVLVFAHILINN